jgi:hypothetical protein
MGGTMRAARTKYQRCRKWKWKWKRRTDSTEEHGALMPGVQLDTAAASAPHSKVALHPGQ